MFPALRTSACELQSSKPKPLFELGQLEVTAAADDALGRRTVEAAIERHRVGDWGYDYVRSPFSRESIADDRKRALQFGGRLSSRYETATGVEFFVITNRDRASTIVCLIHEK